MRYRPVTFTTHPRSFYSCPKISFPSLSLLSFVFRSLDLKRTGNQSSFISSTTNFLKEGLISHNLPCNLASIMAVVAYLVLLLAMTGQSSALYCLCREGLSQTVLQKAIDYACGAGADCTQILQNGPCFQPNTLQDHCNYAVNSYFQRKGQATGSCDFAGAATTNPNPPQNVVNGCVYPSSASTGTGTPTTTPGTTPSTTTPSSTASPGGTSTVFGGTGTTLGPAGSGTGGINDPNGGPLFKPTNLVLSFAFSLWVSFIIVLWG